MGRWGGANSTGEMIRDEGSIERRAEGSGKSPRHPELGGQRDQLKGQGEIRRSTKGMRASGSC